MPITATEKINIRENGRVEGDITAPIVAISEGAQFRGRIDMQQQTAAEPARGTTMPPAGAARPKVAPSADEIAANPRARSARLRIAERL